jgi:hypothetical protein
VRAELWRFFKVSHTIKAGVEAKKTRRAKTAKSSSLLFLLFLSFWLPFRPLFECLEMRDPGQISNTTGMIIGLRPVSF